jgi:hypothetical protein
MLLRSKLFQIAVGVVAFIALLGVLRFKPWQRGGAASGVVTSNDASGRQGLQVGFLPVT